MNGKHRIPVRLLGFIRDSSIARFHTSRDYFFSIYRSRSTTARRSFGLAASVAAALSLSACVESKMPLLTDVRPLLGQQFEVHLYENFVDGKASDFHRSVYQWKDGQYVGSSGLARDAKRFVAQPLAANDFLLQSTDSTNIFNYWLGRKLAVGVYLILPLDETDADDATRTAVCGKNQPEGTCRVASYDQLVTLAHATAAKPIRDAALAVVLTK